MATRLLSLPVLLAAVLGPMAVGAAPLFAPPFFSYDLGNIGSSTYAVGIGDLNGDGRLDLVVADGSAVSVALGNGDGSFGAGHDFTTGRGSRSVAIADLNRDGKLDLVTANYDASTVSVLLGNGDGTFGA